MIFNSEAAAKALSSHLINYKMVWKCLGNTEMERNEITGYSCKKKAEAAFLPKDK